MTPQDFKELYTRELDTLYKEISSYADESKLWILAGEIKNTPGNLALHLIGNVNHFIGALLGNTGYVRNREEEFGAQHIAKEKLLTDITAAKAMIENVMNNLPPTELQKDFPVQIFGTHTTEYMLTYFLGHFMYHLGQINYHRRFV
ncbi:MAG: DUF1572 domain-containing protein [Chitinophagales bacterium]|nr:DUF1572 domain-containing protein [Chitinophagales bacterium]